MTGIIRGGKMQYKRISIIQALIIVSIIFVAVCLLVICVFRGIIKEPGMSTICHDFNTDQEALENIADFFENLGYGNIYISENDMWGTMYVSEGNSVGSTTTISDPIVSEQIYNLLHKRGYSVVGKKSNTIYFQKWSNKNKGVGIAYTIDGSAPVIDFLTEFSNLSAEKWYYYKEDFIKYKAIKNNSGQN